MAVALTRRSFVAGTLASLSQIPSQVSYSFSVLGLLRPSKINIYADRNVRLHLRTGSQTQIVEGVHPFLIDPSLTPLTVTGPQNSSTSFVLEISGIIRRRYTGKLYVSAQENVLLPVVTIDREIAVASIVGAELPTHVTPFHALAAQALASRSFLCAAAARPRHANAQFCDTTHCQFLRSPPAVDSNVSRAVENTRGLILNSGRMVIPAHYSAACGGHTDAAELDHYQYRSVVCEPCRHAGIPRRGHGLGLCQTGAIALAHAGWDFQKIVRKYYPGCQIQSA